MLTNPLLRNTGVSLNEPVCEKPNDASAIVEALPILMVPSFSSPPKRLTVQPSLPSPPSVTLTVLPTANVELCMTTLVTLWPVTLMVLVSAWLSIVRPFSSKFTISPAAGGPPLTNPLPLLNCQRPTGFGPEVTWSHLPTPPIPSQNHVVIALCLAARLVQLMPHYRRPPVEPRAHPRMHRSVRYLRRAGTHQPGVAGKIGVQ